MKLSIPSHPYYCFDTDRLWMRPTHLDDANFIYALLNMPKWKQYIGDRKVHSPAGARNYIQTRMLPQLHRLGYGNYTVVRKADGSKMGTCGLYDRDGLDGLDLGFAFLPDYEGKGYAFEAAAKITEIAYTIFHISNLAAITTTNNHASQKLLHKLHFQYQKAITLPDDDEPLMYFEKRF